MDGPCSCHQRSDRQSEASSSLSLGHKGETQVLLVSGDEGMTRQLSENRRSAKQGVRSNCRHCCSLVVLFHNDYLSSCFRLAFVGALLEMAPIQNPAYLNYIERGLSVWVPYEPGHLVQYCRCNILCLAWVIHDVSKSFCKVTMLGSNDGMLAIHLCCCLSGAAGIALQERIMFESHVMASLLIGRILPV
jgi:hypothetical protein